MSARQAIILVCGMMRVEIAKTRNAVLFWFAVCLARANLFANGMAT